MNDNKNNLLKDKEDSNIINSIFIKRNNSKNYSITFANEFMEKNNFPLAIVELQSIEKSTKDHIFLSQSLKKNKKKRKTNLTDENKYTFLRNNKIINNYYTDFMRRKKHKELIESKII